MERTSTVDIIILMSLKGSHAHDKWECGLNLIHLSFKLNGQKLRTTGRVLKLH